MSRKQSEYFVIVVTRNGASTIKKTLGSLLTQTWKPSNICVINDGSTDGTERILEKYVVQEPKTLRVVSLPDRGYDIRRVPANLNLAYSELESCEARFDYSMISGDDCVYPPDYAAVILNRMEGDPRIAVASGDLGIAGPPDRMRVPQGAGRFVRENFWTKIGRRYPVAAGWEPWVVFKALQLGCKVENLAWLKFQHLRPSGSSHRFRYWGEAMRALGYHPLVAIGRIAKNMFYRNDPIPFSGSISMLTSYLFPGSTEFDRYLQHQESDLRSFVRLYQSARLSAFVSKQLSKLLP